MSPTLAVSVKKKNAFKKGMWKTGKYVKDKKIKERMKKMKTKSYEKLRNIRIKKNKNHKKLKIPR